MIVGINATYRGAELAQLIDHTDCQAARHLRRVRRPARRRHRAGCPPTACSHTGTDDVRRSSWRRSTPIDDRARPSRRRPLPPHLHLGIDRLPEGGALHPGPLRPHGHAREDASPSSARARPSTRRSRSSTRARCSPGWRARCRRRCRSASRARFSASQHDARHPPHGRHDARLHRQGPQLHPRGAAVTRRRRRRRSTFAFGNEASEADIREFAAALRLRGARQLRLDRGADHHPPRRVDAARRARAAPTTPSRCTTPTPARSARAPSSTRRAGCSTPTRRWARSSTPHPATRFEGYYRNEEANASKVRDGIYWSGDLAYRDADGWFFFAGRSNEWLRVDGENFAAAPVERDRAARTRACGRPRCTRCPTTRSATG